MAAPYMAEIRMMAFNFAPRGWAFCQGQLLSIQQNSALFSLLGVSYGGNGVSTFALPKLNGNAPVGGGVPGRTAGSFSASLVVSNLPGHTHDAYGSSVIGTAEGPTSTSLMGATASTEAPYYSTTAAPAATMSPLMITGGGNSQPFSVMQPYIVMNFAIALNGIYPSRN